jgi:hypothetical protein
MTPEEARAIALRLMQSDPKLKSVNMNTLIAKIMANEGVDKGPIQTPGGISQESLLAGLLPPKEVSPASPAPMQPGVAIAAPKPTADMLMPAVGGPEETAPAAAPAARPVSRFQPALDAAIYEMEQMTSILDQAKNENVAVPEEAKLKIRTLNDRINRLKAYVAAEQGAAVDPERLAIMERQKERLSREEQLLNEAKKRSPWEALAQAGFAMAQGRKGEGFGSALSRGLQAGLTKFTGSRDEDEKARLLLDARRDDIAMSNINALEQARERARQMVSAGYAIDKETMDMARMTDDAIVNQATRAARIQSTQAGAQKAQVEADMARDVIQSEIDYRKAAGAAAGTRAAGANQTGIPRGVSTVYNALASQAKSLRDAIRDPITRGADRDSYKQQLAGVLRQMRALEEQMGFSAGSSPFVTGGKKPDLVYDPKKGLSPAK